MTRRLIVRPGGVGDCILSLPAIEHLRTGYTEVWVPSAVVPLIHVADRVRQRRGDDEGVAGGQAVLVNPVSNDDASLATVEDFQGIRVAWVDIALLARGDHRYAEPHRLVARVLTAFLRALEESPCFLSPDDARSRQTTVV